MLTRIALAITLIGASVTASAAADRNVPIRNTAAAQAQVQAPKARNAQQSYNAAPSDLQSLYQLGARIRRDTFTHD